MQQAYEMAVDALGLAITSRKQERESIPVPSQPYDLTVGEGEYTKYLEMRTSYLLKQVLNSYISFIFNNFYIVILNNILARQVVSFGSGLPCD